MPRFGARSAVTGVLRFLLIVVLANLGFVSAIRADVPAGAAPAGSGSRGVAGDRPGVRAPDAERRLVVVPFESEELTADLKYLEQALAEALAAQIRAVGLIVVKDRQARFKFSPREPAPPDVGSKSAGGKAPLGPHRSAEPSLVRASLDARVVTWDKNSYRAGRLYDDVRRARLLDADILVTGLLAAQSAAPPADVRQGRALSLTLRVYEAASGNSATLRIELRERTALGSLQPTALAIVRFVSVLPPVPVVIESDPDNTLVFIGERYLGRTPLTAHLVPGSYVLQFQHEGRRSLTRALVVKQESKEQKVVVRLVPHVGRAGLSVKSEPPGADVYLNAEHIGKTPLLRRDLPAGPHRLRLAQEGRIDRIVGVELADGQDKSVELTLRAGHTGTSFADAPRAFLDWTWYDLHFYSLISGLVAYGAYVYYDIQEDRIEEGVRWNGPLVLPAIAQLTSVGTLSVELLAHQYYVLQNNRRLVAKAQSGRGASFGVGVASLVAAAAFLFLDIQFKPEAGELQGFVRFGSPVFRFVAPGSDGAARTELGFSLSF